VPAKAAINKDKRKSKLSLFFDDAVGLWCPKRWPCPGGEATIGWSCGECSRARR